jgi:3'-5' exoribonuclease
MHDRIKDIKNGLASELIVRFVDIKERTSSSNSAYFTLSIYDGEDSIDAKIWDISDKKEWVKSGEVYRVYGKGNEFAGKVQFIITEVHKLEEHEQDDLKKFYKYAKISKEQLEEYIFGYAKRIENHTLSTIVMKMINKYFMKYFEFPAAVTMHHNYLSGLAYHVYSMLKLSDVYFELYPFLNKDLLYSGILLHDIGKVVELSEAKGPEYTKFGNLIGHITITSNEVAIVANELGVSNEDEVIGLQHLILSHHGEMQYGSPKEPMMAEAIALYLIDSTDAKMAGIESEVEATEQGFYTNQIPSLNRKTLYVPKIKK